MTRRLRLLLVEEDPQDAELITSRLETCGFDVDRQRVDTCDALDAALATSPEIVIWAGALPRMDALDVLRRVRQAAPDASLIVIGGTSEEAEGAPPFRHGAFDRLHEDRLGRLGQAVTATLVTGNIAQHTRDVEHRRQSTANLLSALVDHAPAAICIHDAQGVELVSNERYRRLLGHGLPEGLPAILAASARSMRDESALDDSGPIASEPEIELTGSTYLALAFPVVDGASRPEANGVILTDVTRLKRIESELRAARSELRRQARQLRASNARLTELDRLRTDLVNTVSHELRTPLTSIVGYTELLADGEPGMDPSVATSMLRMIAGNSKRLLDLIDNLLDLGRMDAAPAGSDLPSAAQVDLVELVGEGVKVMLPIAERTGVSLVTELAPHLPPLTGDRAQLERALLNLVSNAIKFSPAGADVTIRGACVDGAVVIDVVDQGVGISRSDLARVGDRFFRAASARSGEIQGTGLGLSVVHSIARQHGGELILTSQEGRGTQARLRLPVREALSDEAG